MAKLYDVDKIRERYEKARVRGQAERHAYERNWFRNVLFYLGIQWILYLPNNRMWVPRNLKTWVPRPVTNKFASHVNSVVQILTSRSPDLSVSASTESVEDIATADMANRVLPVLLKEARYKYARRARAMWMVLTGSAFSHPCYDNDPMAGVTKIQHLRCAECGKTFAPDEAGEPVPVTMPAMEGASPEEMVSALEESEEPQMSEESCPFCQSYRVEPAVGDDGVPIEEELPNGRLNIEIFSPFEVHLDLEARSMFDVQELLVRRRYPLDFIRRKYDQPSLEADGSSANTGGTIGLNLLRAIAYASGNSQYGTGYASGRNIGDDMSITVDYLWVRPCTEFPKGLVAAYANDILLNEKLVKDGIPYINRKGQVIWPWHIHRFDEVPGRIMGKTPMDDVAPKQEQRNKLESLMELIVKRTANPVWLIAKGVGITEITGEPGEILSGNWGTDPRLKPTREAGENIPTSLMAWLEKIDRDMEELAGVFEVLKGSAPSGVTAGTALRLLLERAVTRFTPVIERDEEVTADVVTDLLCVFQQYGSEERKAKIQGEDDTFEIQRFNNADLSGSVDVTVEAGSGVPVSTVGQQAMIQDLATMQVVDVANPDTQYKILQKFGMTSLLGSIDKNIKQVHRENFRFQKEKKIPQVNPIIDNHIVHVKFHKDLALTSGFEEMDETLKGQFLTHIIDHQMYMAGLNGGVQPAPGAAGPSPVDGQPPGGQPGNVIPFPGGAPGPEDGGPEAGIPPIPGGPM